jgi:hypothetical protein
MQPQAAFSGTPTWQPYAATTFRASGQYGSTLWDPVLDHSRKLMINVCDDCLRALCDRVMVVHTIRRSPDVEYSAWDPDTSS